MPLDLEERREDIRRSDDQESGLPKTFGVAIAVVSLVGTIFAAGYNWRSISNIEAAQTDYVRKDVQGQQMRNVDDRLSEIIRQLEELRGEVRATRRDVNR